MKKFDLSKINSKNVAFTGIIIIFTILLLQSTVSLFIDMPFEGLSQIDVVFRTSISSIFGYIMSMVSTGDFSIKGKTPQTPQQSKIGFEIKSDGGTPLAVSKSDFATDENNTAQAPKRHSYTTRKKTLTVNVQIIVLTVVCIFCLGVMLVVRNFSELIAMNSSNNVTISQFRDIISGSVGALLGLSRSNN